MKRWLLAALLCLAPFGADAQTTKAQYTNQDGSSSAAVAIQCPDPNNAGKTYPCVFGSGGGGGGAVYGPTANGSPAANPPVLQGGTSDGSATGAVGNVKVDSAGSTYPKPVTTATTNAAGTITTGGTFQQLAAASTTRLSVDFQNLSGNGDACYVFFGSGAATTGTSIKVADQQEYIRTTGIIPSDKIQVTCATTSDAFYAAVQ